MKEQLSDKSFKIMSVIMNIMEVIHPYAQQRAETFGIYNGMTVVDYACGPGRYTMEFAKLVGEQGKVFAVDLKEIGLKMVEAKAKRNGFNNIHVKLAHGYNSPLESEIADMIVALDVFFMIEDTTKFLAELSRICKKDGILILDDGHQSRAETKKKLARAQIWKIIEETKDHLKCKKIQ